MSCKGVLKRKNIHRALQSIFFLSYGTKRKNVNQEMDDKNRLYEMGSALIHPYSYLMSNLKHSLLDYH